MGHELKKIAGFALPIAGTIIGSSFGQPELGSIIGGALGGATKGRGLKGIGLGAAEGFAGNVIGNELGGVIGKGIGSTAANTTFGSLTGDAIGGALGQKTVGSALSGFAGNQIADGLASSLIPQQTSGTSQKSPSLIPTPETPTRAPQLQLPGSLSGLAGLDSMQQASNIANQGVYGQGNGPQEQGYFNNLINNQLIDPSGKFQDISSLSPIENSYLSQLGLGGYSNSKDLLGAISKWQSA